MGRNRQSAQEDTGLNNFGRFRQAWVDEINLETEGDKQMEGRSLLSFEMHAYTIYLWLSIVLLL